MLNITPPTVITNESATHLTRYKTNELDNQTVKVSKRRRFNFFNNLRHSSPCLFFNRMFRSA